MKCTMSILIKGMEMPESCYYCPFADGVWQKNKRCLINGKEMPRDGRNVQQNHLTCPLIEVSSDDVQPVKHGKWIADGDGYHWTYNCSICGWKDGYPFNERHNFCPNCGAKMET